MTKNNKKIDAQDSVVHHCQSHLADKGDLTDAQVKQVLEIVIEYRERMLRQWELFKQGRPIRIIKVRKTK